MEDLTELIKKNVPADDPRVNYDFTPIIFQEPSHDLLTQELNASVTAFCKVHVIMFPVLLLLYEKLFSKEPSNKDFVFILWFV